MRTRSISLALFLCGSSLLSLASEPAPAPAPSFDKQVMPLLKARCVKCHGPAKREGGVNLATPKGVARGGKDGAVVVPGQADDSELWARVAENEMPPEEPLEPAEKAVLRRWIEKGAPGLPKINPGEPEGADHWAFAPASRPEVPGVRDGRPIRTVVDRFVQARLEANGLGLGPEADRATLARRVCFDLTGLPPTPEEIARFVEDHRPGAYERLVERYLASPHYGERWGKYWLDTAGYTDSNGYFNADTDRPLAYRYRDYVIRSWNEDRPLDEFVREQLAGDEMAGFRAGVEVTPKLVDQLVATHYLRNSPDGSGESDGNDDEVRADKYAVLEGTTQIIGSSLLGMTFQCARCHDHKFEPITQADYYQIYAILWPAFDLDRWVKPQKRITEAATPVELAAWESRARQVDGEIAALRKEFMDWARQNRQKGTVLFQDDFDSTEPLAARWSATAPGDNAPAGNVSVKVDSDSAPGALARDGALRIIESGSAGNRWLSTRSAFDWTPEEKGGWVQVTFDLLDTKLAKGDGDAERVGYYIALTDYDDGGPKPGGNVLIDGNPAGGAAIDVDYPGSDMDHRGVIGSGGYVAGQNYGVRVTNLGGGKFLLEHLINGVPEGKSLKLSAADLPDGGFGFEYCCGRSFIVDHVCIESGKSGPSAPGKDAPDELVKARRKALDDAVAALSARKGDRPGQVAAVSDLSTTPSQTHLLRRGLYNDPGPKIDPAPPSILSDPQNPFEVRGPESGAPSTGRRSAFARWLTRPGSRPASLMARVLVNRLWQSHFGVGLVPTTDNFGYSGTPPTHPELLEFLADELVQQGWRPKALHRLILNSAAYRQSSETSAEALRIDPDNSMYSRFPVLRLDAEAVRDAMLAASGELDDRVGGPYIPTVRSDGGDGVIESEVKGPRRRSVYLQQRRTQVVSLLDVFDAPSLVTNCSRRNPTATPLQSLSLLNSQFALTRAQGLATRLREDRGTSADAKVDRAFLLTTGHAPSAEERAAALKFLEAQPSQYPGRADAVDQAWADLCQMLFASNTFLYVE